LLEGKCLRQRLLHGPAKLAEVQTIVQQASGALAKAHSLGISHGRLRPDYLYLTELAQKPFLKLAGFGELTEAAEAANQHAYWSPEQFRAGSGGDARSDLWAFAVSLYELLTTTLPFEAQTPSEVAAAICNTDFARPTLYRADLPRTVDGWFAKALAKDPSQRFSEATELARAFVGALANEAPAAAAPMSRAPGPLSMPPGMPPLPAMSSAMSSPSMSMSASGGSARPLPSFPPPSAPPPLPSAAHGARTGELELSLADGEDDDEQTVQWDVEDRAPAAEHAGAPLALPSVALPSLGSRLPMLPLPAPLSPAALSSVALPSTSSQRASAGPLGTPPSLEPSVYLDSPYMASVASALAVPIYTGSSYTGAVPIHSGSAHAVAAEPAPQGARRLWPFTPDKTWLAALAFAAGVAVTWFTYDPGREESASAEVASAVGEPSVIRTLSVDDLPRAPGDEADLPKIVRTSQLPAADDEPVMANAPASVSVERRAAPVQRVQALVPAPAPARAKPQAQAQAAPRAKPVAEARGTCTPPYYFDEKGIQRVKAECLGGSGMITGPYGAALPTRAGAKAAPAVAPGASAAPPAAVPPKSASAGKPAASACNPPYYFEGNIRRIKLECL